MPANDTELLKACLAAKDKGVFIPIEDYHRLDGISGSGLKLLAESNWHFENKKLFQPETNSLSMGSLVHAMVLEPDTVKDKYVVMPVFQPKKNKDDPTIDQQKQDFLKANEGKELVNKDDFEKAEKMANNVFAIAGDIVEQGIKERSFFVEIDDLILKSRCDIDLDEIGDEYDLKVISSAHKQFSNKLLEWAIKDYKYHWSAALRNIVRRELGKPVRDNYLIFCDTSPGNMVKIVRMNREWIDEAEEEVNELLLQRRIYLNLGIDNSITEIDGRRRSE